MSSSALSSVDPSLTVEAYLKSRTLTLASSITSHAEHRISQLQEQMRQGKKELIKVHERCKRGGDGWDDAEDKENDSNGAANDSASKKQRVERGSANANESASTSASTSTKQGAKQATRETAAATTKAAPATATKGARGITKVLSVSVTSGPHLPLVTGPYTLTLKPSKPCYVGRSQGKKFTTNGLSLSKDLEVSTTHGTFSLTKAGIVYYTDTGSTNGSYVIEKDGKEEQLEEGVEYQVKEGGGVRVGATVLKWNFVE